LWNLCGARLPGLPLQSKRVIYRLLSGLGSKHCVDCQSWLIGLSNVGMSNVPCPMYLSNDPLTN